jgi:hypothetical protein
MWQHCRCEHLSQHPSRTSDHQGAATAHCNRPRGGGKWPPKSRKGAPPAARPSLVAAELKKQMRCFFCAKSFCVLQKKVLGKTLAQVAASGRQYTRQTTCRWHPVATGAVRHIEVLKTAGGSESVSTLSRPEWPSWPFLPYAWMQESSELLPATGPRAARCRADAGEAAGCTVVATAKLAPLSLKIYTTHTHPISYPTTCSS